MRVICGCHTIWSLCISFYTIVLLSLASWSLNPIHAHLSLRASSSVHASFLQETQKLVQFERGGEGFRVHTRFPEGWHAGLTCRVSWVEDQGEGDEGSSGGVRVEGAPANTDDLCRVWHTHNTQHTQLEITACQDSNHEILSLALLWHFEKIGLFARININYIPVCLVQSAG